MAAVERTAERPMQTVPWPATAAGPAVAPAAPQRPQPTALIAVATFQRPDGLARTLDGIARLALQPAWRVEMLVVDNCPDGSARDAVLARAAGFPVPLHYVHETERGISHARNRALDEAALRGKTYLAFLDDDEEPTPGWLAAMIAVAERRSAAAVVGPVEARFETPPPAWVRRGGFHDIPGGVDAAPIIQNTAGNSLIRLSEVDRLGLRFDPAFALSGGEDTMFFTALRRAGGETFFAADATILEDISPKRAGLGWLMTRWYRTGITPVAVAVALGGGRKARAKAAFGGAARAVLGAIGAVVASPLLLAGSVAPYRALRIVCRGAGMVAGAFGVAFEEYRSDRK